MMMSLSFANLAQLPSEILGANHQSKLASEIDSKSAATDSEKENIKIPEASTNWAQPQLGGHHLPINPLLFTNRSSCAADAEKPAITVNLLIDSMYPAKMIYRLAQATGHDPKQLTKQGVERFRSASYRLLEKIAYKIARGELPLLHAKNDDLYFRNRFSNHQLPAQEQYRYQQEQQLGNYISLSRDCRLDENCIELDLYLEKLWLAKGDKNQLAQIDNFTTEHFINSKKFVDNTSRPFDVSCHYLKKFSPLMAQVSTVGANKKVLEAVALTLRQQNDYIADCDDLDAQSSLEAVAYQIDLLNIDPEYWKRVGFDFWHTLKLFYSWSFRHAQDIESVLYPFENIFPSINLEESVMLFSADCRGLTLPSCDNDFLSSQRIRDFAKLAFNEQALNNDFMKEVPEGSAQQLLDNPFVDYNNDILEYGEFPDLGKWAQNFSENMRRARTHHKKKLLNAVGFLDRLISKLSIDDFSRNLEQITSEKKNWSWPQGSITIPEMKNQLYYLCAEYQIAANQNFSLLRSEINLYAQDNKLDAELTKISGRTGQDYLTYFDQLSTQVISFCQSLEKKNLWQNFEVDRNGFAPWFQQIVNKETVEKSALDLPAGTPEIPAFLVEVRKEGKEILCYSAVDCARKALDSIIAIHATQKYMRTMITSEQQLNSPSLQNPYAERTACKIYDPWWKVKKTLFNSFFDLSAAAINLVNPMPIFLSLDYVPQRAVSFNSLAKDGVIAYDPQMSGSNWFGSLNLDLAKILNIPCTVSVGNHSAGLANDRRYFTGYTFQGCAINKDGGEISITSDSQIDGKMAQTLQGCASCSINFETVSNLVASTLNIPVVSSSYYLIRGITYFFRGMSDPIEIPHRWEVDVNNVYQTYRRYGSIPEGCVNSLVKGKHCLANRCEYTIGKAAGYFFDAQIEKIELEGNHAFVKLNRCRQDILVKDFKTLGLYCRDDLKVENFMTNSSCNFPSSKRRP